VVVSRALRAACLLLVTASACASTPPHAAGEVVRSAVAEDTAGHAIDLREAAAGAPFTVVTFFSAHCPCQAAHDERLREIYAEYAPRGVQFFAVDAEAGASRDRASHEAAARGYPYPILVDAAGATIDALGADYATYTVVLDRGGHIRYVGGIDSDRQHLTPDAKTYLRDALTDLVAGNEPRLSKGKALGCALQRP
jgi:Redoxin